MLLCTITKPRAASSYTTSSADMRSGLTYSKPSNSLWSIFPMRLLKRQCPDINSEHDCINEAFVKISKSSVILLGLRVVWRELHRLVGELRGEVGEVPLALQPRPVRRRDLLLLELKCTREGQGRELRVQKKVATTLENSSNHRQQQWRHGMNL